MPIPKAKRIQVLREYRDAFEKGKVFGTVQLEHDGDPEHPDEMVYETHREFDEHCHRIMHSWAISEEIFDELVAMQVDKIRVVSRPTAGAKENMVYEIAMPTAIKHGNRYQYPDCDMQMFIPLERFYDPRSVWF